jgi:DNA-binding GntR family transcriptional regulator
VTLDRQGGAERPGIDGRGYGHGALRVYHEVRMMILRRELPPGAPVVAVEIARRLGLSRMPVREALTRLEAEKLVRVVPRRGVFVRILAPDEVRNDYEAAEALEGMIAYLAAPNMDRATLARLRRLITGMDRELARAQPDFDTWLSLDEAFHDTIISRCNNELLAGIRRQIYSRIEMSRLSMNPWYADKKKSNIAHRAIYDALARHDAERARRTTEKHWKRARDAYLKVVQRKKRARRRG